MSATSDAWKQAMHDVNHGASEWDRAVATVKLRNVMKSLADGSDRDELILMSEALYEIRGQLIAVEGEKN